MGILGKIIKRKKVCDKKQKWAQINSETRSATLSLNFIIFWFSDSVSGVGIIQIFSLILLKVLQVTLDRLRISGVRAYLNLAIAKLFDKTSSQPNPLHCGTTLSFCNFSRQTEHIVMWQHLSNMTSGTLIWHSVQSGQVCCLIGNKKKEKQYN